MEEMMHEIENLEADPEIVKVFAVILYSDRHPYIKKVLRDEDYWKALDEISGSRWTIFSARAIEGRREIRGAGPPGTLSTMLQVWVEPAENKELLLALGLSSTEDPTLVIFTRLQNGQILKSVIPLDDSSVESAYKRLIQVITQLTKAIENIQKENIEDYQSVFNGVNMTAERIRNIDTLKDIFAAYQWLKKLKP